MKPCTPFHMFNHHYSKRISLSEYDCIMKILDCDTNILNKSSKGLLMNKLQLLRNNLYNEICTEKNDDKHCALCGDLILTGYTDGLINICSMSELFTYLDILYGKDGWRVSTTDEYTAYDECYIMIADENGIFRASNWKPIYPEE